MMMISLSLQRSCQGTLLLFSLLLLVCCTASNNDNSGYGHDGTNNNENHATPTTDSLLFANNNIDDEEIMEKVSLVIHRNGEPDGCGEINAEKTTTILQKDDIQYLNKYQLETYLTQRIAENLKSNDNVVCGSTDDENAMDGLYGFCDMGTDRTPILLDHHKLQRIPATNSLPCRWFTREGLRLSNWNQLVKYAHRTQQKNNELEKSLKVCENPAEPCANDADNDNSSITEIHIYGVPAGRVFMFAPSYVGETFELDHMVHRNDARETIVMEVLSVRPRVFDIYNIFTQNEASALIDRALRETSESHRLKRSTTGTIEHSVFQRRTSENSFDTHGQVAVRLKRRVLEMLGFDEFWDGHDDGLQVLRYNQTKAYTPHMDYLTSLSNKELYDYDSAGKGGNRFATVLLYMTDLPNRTMSGGETVFSEAWAEGSERMTTIEAINRVRESGIAAAAGIEENTWEEEMVATCRTRLSVQPYKGRAVLFYSQHPNGKQDFVSKHGGCPVLDGTKWAANLWVWNAPRTGFKGQPLRQDLIDQGVVEDYPQVHKQIQAIFVNSGKKYLNAELYFDEAQFWGNLNGVGSRLAANTYEGHRWNVMVDGEIVQTWVIGNDARQTFSL